MPFNSAWNFKKCGKIIALWALLSILLFSMKAPGAAEARLEYRVKAAFLINFAKFTEWPNSVFASAKSPIIFATLGDNPFGKSLEEMTTGKTIHSRPVSVKHYFSTKDLASGSSPHVVFVATSNTLDQKELFEAISKLNMLIVTDSSISAEKKGIFDFVMEGSNVRFDVNLVLANQANIKISSEVLKLARRVVQDKT